jgi:hypothetical protein
MPFRRPTPGWPMGRPGVGHPQGVFGIFSRWDHGACCMGRGAYGMGVRCRSWGIGRGAYGVGRMAWGIRRGASKRVENGHMPLARRACRNTIQILTSGTLTTTIVIWRRYVKYLGR